MKIDELLETPYYVVDFLPEQVPANSAGQYFAIEDYYSKEPRISEIRRKLANIVLKLNCYYDIAVWDDLDADSSEITEFNPAPEKLAGLFAGVCAEECVRLLIRNENTLIITNKDDLCMAVHNPSDRLISLLRSIACSEGMFIWKVIS